MSKTVRKYLSNLGIQSFSSSKKEVTLYKTKPLLFPVEELRELFEDIEYPAVVGMHFIRDNKRKFDFSNICQILPDLLTAFDIIPDDNMDYFIPVPLMMGGKYYSYDKENPGVYIEILNYR